LGIGVAIMYFVYISQSEAYKQECILKGIAEKDCSLLKKVYGDFVHSNLLYLLGVIFLFFLSNISRAIRWQMMMKPIGVDAKFKTAFHSIMLGYFANLGIPRIGEFVRAGALAKNENVKFDKVMGTIVLDRLLDVISLLIVFLITIMISSGQILNFISSNSDLADKINNILGSKVFWFVIVAGIVVMLFFIKSKKFKNSFIGKKVFSFLKGIVEGIKSIRSVRKPGWFLFHSIFIWFMYFMMNYVGFKAFLPTAGLGLKAAVTVFTFGSLGIVIPSPGGMGTYHFLVIEALKLFGVNGSDGFSYANIIFFSVQIIGIIAFGILALFSLNISTKKLTDELQKQNI
jgi:uncharacterized protein (TIRG00374 family)